MSLDRAIEIVKTLAEHEARKGLSVAEIAEDLGQFPSDVEQTLKDLQQEGVVKCYMFKGILYAVFEQPLTDDIKRRLEDNQPDPSGEAPDAMFR